MIRNIPAVRPPEWPDYHPLFGYVDADVEVQGADRTITTFGVFLDLDPIDERDLAGVRNAVLTDVAWAVGDSDRVRVVRETVVWTVSSVAPASAVEQPKPPRPRRLNLRSRCRPVALRRRYFVTAMSSAPASVRCGLPATFSMSSTRAEGISQLGAEVRSNWSSQGC